MVSLWNYTQLQIMSIKIHSDLISIISQTIKSSASPWWSWRWISRIRDLKILYIVTTLNNTGLCIWCGCKCRSLLAQNYTSKIAIAPGPRLHQLPSARNTDIHPESVWRRLWWLQWKYGYYRNTVIDTPAGTMYFVTKIVNPNDRDHRQS